MRTCIAIILAALGLTASLSLAGCPQVNDPPAVTVTPAADVPVPSGFDISERDPVPRSEMVDSGKFRFHDYAFTKMGEYGYDNAAKHFLSVLWEKGWKKLDAKMTESGTATSRQKWVGRFTKGTSQTLTVSYEERLVDNDGDRRPLSRIYVHIEGRE